MNLEIDGYGIIKQAFSERECLAVIDDLELAISVMSIGSIKNGSGACLGARNLLSWWDGCLAIVRHATIRTVVAQILGENAGLVRAIYFDKPPGRGWSLPMHRDLTIAVAEHCVPAAPFSKPTTKAGTPHVEATRQLLRGMVTLRLHLDPMLQENGPLMVVPHSHRSDVKMASSHETVVMCNAGDLLVMRPLLLHGSRASDRGTRLHRRVIHLEFAPSDELPRHYQWHQFLPIHASE
jgi:ectoine hydroxylase-related dioxygenase (phytanoyl-CoA dioxygenase family)